MFFSRLWLSELPLSLLTSTSLVLKFHFFCFVKIEPELKTPELVSPMKHFASKSNERSKKQVFFGFFPRSSMSHVLFYALVKSLFLVFLLHESSTESDSLSGKKL